MAAVDFRELDAIAADVFGDEALYTPPTGGAPVAVHPVMSGGAQLDRGLGPTGHQADTLAGALLMTEVPADPSPVPSIGGGPDLRARLTVTTGAFPGAYTIASAARAATGGAWDCVLEAA
jgi:hypothetical protein